MNVAFFAVLYTTLIHALPFHDPKKLVVVSEGLPALGFGAGTFSAPDFGVYQRTQKSLQAVGIMANREYELSGSGDPERIPGARISASLFDVLGTSTALGRTFIADEDRGDTNVAI